MRTRLSETIDGGQQYTADGVHCYHKSGRRLLLGCVLMCNNLPLGIHCRDIDVASVNKSCCACHSQLTILHATCNTHSSTADDVLQTMFAASFSDLHPQVRWLNRMLDLCHWYLLSTRVMLTQHSAALAALQAANSSSSSPTKPDAVMHYHEPGHKSTNPQQVYTPPHQQLAGSAATAVSLVRRQARVLDMVKLVAEDCR
jgi:hypothetical protein